MTVSRIVSKSILPVAAAGLFTLAIAYAFHSQRPIPLSPPPVTPATNPFGPVVAGTGMVEPATESSTQATITVGSQLAGVISEVFVHIDQKVNAGDVLFALDTRQARAELKIRETALATAKSQLKKLQQQPRPEEIPPLEAQVRNNEANLRTQTDLRDRDRKLFASKAVTEQEMVTREQAVQAAQAQLDISQANLKLLKAGAWQPDKDIAAAAVEQARAQVEQAETLLALLEVRAPLAGSVLQINIRPGEFVASSPTQSLVVMGNLDALHVRVNIDEEDIPRLKLNSPAIAKLRGDLQRREIPMKYVRIEPYVIPKTSLTGINTERVDTRVMQIIYSIDPNHALVKDHKILVGQLLDVFIDVK